MKRKAPIDEQERNRLLDLFEQQGRDETRLTPGFQTHEQLWSVAKRLPSDYEPYGETDRGWNGDCSCGCRWYHVLAGRAGHDWGVCANAASPRAGLLTFEHQGCPQFETDDRSAYLETAEGQSERRKFEEREKALKSKG